MMRALLAESLSVLRLLSPHDAIRWHLGLVSHAREAVAGATLAPADRSLGGSFGLAVARQRCRMLGTDFGVCRELVGRDCYRFAPHAADARHVIDLGANAGVFSIMAALMSQGCRVTAVEANPDLVEVARVNLAAAGVLPRITLLNEVVGRSYAACGGASGPRRFSPAEAIARWGPCDFLKCDVEGSEHSLFDGDLGWLDSVDAMAIEYHWSRGDGEALAAVLESRGFHVEIEPRRRLGYLHCRRSAASR